MAGTMTERLHTAKATPASRAPITASQTPGTRMTKMAWARAAIVVAKEQAKTEIKRKRTADVTRTFRRTQRGATIKRISEKVSAGGEKGRKGWTLINKEAIMRVLTDGLGDGHVKTQWAQGERSLLPAGITLFADPEHLDHQEDPLKEHHNSNGQHDPLLGSPWSDTHDGKDDGEASSPDGAVEESTDCDRGMSGGSN